MPDRVDFTGQSFGRATVIGPGQPGYWRVRCGCGAEIVRPHETLLHNRRYGREVRCHGCRRKAYFGKQRGANIPRHKKTDAA